MELHELITGPIVYVMAFTVFWRIGRFMAERGR